MAVTETYVDPAIAGNSGAGTIGDPYGDLQYALDTMTRDAVNGDRINIKAGTDELLTGVLSLASYGTPTISAPLVFQGYTAAADDGGIGGIDANANGPVFESTSTDYMGFVDLSLKNPASGDYVVRVDDNCFFRGCSFEGFNDAILFLDNNNIVEYCSFENCSHYGINGDIGNTVRYCTFRNGVRNFLRCINMQGPSTIENNVFIIDEGTIAIALDGSINTIRNNSIYSVNGTGSGIFTSSSSQNYQIILNNILEGFSGVGGKAIDMAGSIAVYGNNKFFNNTTNEILNVVIVDLGNNDTLAASPFLDAAGDDFRVSALVQGLADPIGNFPDLSVRSYLDIGALQRKSYPLVHPGMGGGIRD